MINQRKIWSPMEILENLQKILEWQSEGKQTALSTVVWKQGSALRSVGAKMAISSAMEMSGSVSGGCVEGAVVQEALKVMESGQPVLLDYGIADETAWSVGLACGGSIKVLVQKVEEGDRGILNTRIVSDMIELLQAGVPFSTLSTIDGNAKDEFNLVKTSESKVGNEPSWFSQGLLEQVRSLEETETSQIVKIGAKEIFIDIYAPLPRLIAIGAVHIALPLTQMAQITGFNTVIIDPRKAFNTARRFPHVGQRLLKWPDEGLEEVGLNEKDYLLLLTHDDKLDLPALQLALDRKVKYIGMLSSRQARDKRYQKLEELGYTREQLQRIHAPVGLDIGARSQEEIALSILAEMTAVRYGKTK
jgi:xanthine dehydrogenase accessory factor